MPSPIGHALGGLLVGLALGPRAATSAAGAANLSSRRWWAVDWRFLAVSVFAACLPDIDFAWGRHNMETHSLAFVGFVGVIAWVATRSSVMAATAALACGTHVLFDWLGSDDSPPLGVMALWPFSDAFYFADAYVFATISRRYWLPGFIEHNVLAVLREVVLLLPLVMLAGWIRDRGDRRRAGRDISHGGTKARSSR